MQESVWAHPPNSCTFLQVPGSESNGSFKRAIRRRRGSHNAVVWAIWNSESSHRIPCSYSTPTEWSQICKNLHSHIIIFFFGVVEYSGKGLSMIPHVHSLVILDPVDKLDSSFDPIYWTHPKGFSSESLLKSPVFP
jgi:hypothetical protein